MELMKDVFTDLKKNQLNISYTGSFDSHILSIIAQNLENTFSNNAQTNKKLFKIFIELAQNIALYSAERISLDISDEFAGFGSIFIKEFENYYKLYSGNMAKKEDISPAIIKCNAINSMPREELREYKRKQRRLPPGKKGGGNIGLIQIALMSSNPIEYQVIDIGKDNHFYIIAIKIDKIAIDN